MSTTLAALIDEVLLNMSSYGMVQSRYATLGSGVDASATTLTVSTTTGFEVGHTAEVGDELVYVTAKDSAASTVTVIRGHRSTSANSHSTGSLVSCNPLWPRWMVRRAINDAIIKSYPDLFGVTVTSLSGTALYNAYTLPSDCERVREVKIQDLTGTREWLSYSQWRYDFQRKELNLHVTAYETQPISVVYLKRPQELTDGQTLVDSGLSDSARPYVTAKATADLVSRMDNQRLQVNFASAADMAANRPSGSANSLAKTLLAVANMELHEERRRLTQQYPPIVNTAKGRF